MPNTKKTTAKIKIICMDIGSVKKKRFGWWHDDKNKGDNPEKLAEFIATSLNQDDKVALGIECPLFIPLPDNQDELTSPRKGEGNRAWSAAAGAAVTTIGIPITTWTFGKIRELIKNKSIELFFDYRDFCNHKGPALFIWEAFVSNKSPKNEQKGENPHINDAKKAAEELTKIIKQNNLASAITPDDHSISLVGLAVLRSGLSNDLELLKKPTLVVKA